jgi:phage FluMu protein Com
MLPPTAEHVSKDQTNQLYIFRQNAVMINKSSNIVKTNNHISTQINEFTERAETSNHFHVISMECKALNELPVSMYTTQIRIDMCRLNVRFST